MSIKGFETNDIEFMICHPAYRRAPAIENIGTGKADSYWPQIDTDVMFGRPCRTKSAIALLILCLKGQELIVGQVDRQLVCVHLCVSVANTRSLLCR